MRFSELFTTIAEVFTDFAREYEKTYLEDMSNLRDTYTITNSTVEPYIEARLSYDDAKRQNVDDIVRGRPQEALVKGQEAQAACLERVRSAEKAYVNGCAAISVESCVMVGDSLVSLAGAFGHLWDKVAEVRPRIEALRDTAAEDRKSVSSADTHNAYPQYIDIAEGLYDSEERYLSTLTVIDSFKQRITGAEALKITHSESETMFLNLGNISNNQSDLCRMLKRVMDTARNETLGRDLALAVGTKLRALEDAYLPYIENYALAEYYLDAVRKKKAGAAQIRSFEKTCAESDINPFLVSKMLEEPCHHMSSTYNHLKGILAKTSRDAPAWQQINVQK